MSATATPAFGPGPGDARGLNRAISWSLLVHVVALTVLFVVPRDWLSKSREQPPIMTISLGGTPGPNSTGTTAIGGRTVEQVAPPPRRPEPIRPTPKEDPAPIPVKPQAARPAAPKPTAPPPVTATRPPVTGPQVVEGSSRVDTGARGQGTGLQFGGGDGTGGETDLRNFCCPEFAQHLLSQVSSHWQKDQPERGLTVLKFTIRKDGSLAGLPIVETSSGSSVLDRLARNAVNDSRFLPLPAEYPRDTLTVHLRFPYSGSSR